MFERIIKRIQLMKILNEENCAHEKINTFNQSVSISTNLNENLKTLQNTFKKCNDVTYREFSINNKDQVKAFICFIEGLEDKTLINNSIIKPLMNMEAVQSVEDINFGGDMLKSLSNNLLNNSEVSTSNNIDVIVDEILSGKSVLFIDGYDEAIILNTIGIETRAIEEPNTEVLVRGPREGFIENIKINISMLRRKIKNPNLKFETLQLGKQTRTKVAISYIEGIADEKTVEEVRRRLNNINIDSVLESGYIEQLIQDNPLSPFPTVGNSERPDKVAGKLLEGRVAILCDGTPFVLTVPYIFVENIQVSGDYYSHYMGATFIRFIRVMGLFMTLFVPALYIALSTYHPEMVPSVLLMTSATSREGTPFPTIIETIIMTIIFEVLRESGVRLPRQLGQALSIVGVLVIGEAAVQAGIISSPMIIISALTGITSFLIVPLLDSLIIFRYFFIILSGFLGFYGIVLGTIIMVAHVCSLKSFGIPYLSSFAPTIWNDLKDGVVRLPIWMMKNRPKSIKTKNIKREKGEIMDKVHKDSDGDIK